MRIVVKNAKGEKELKGTLRISHMIPVPLSELELFNSEEVADDTYNDLVQQEIMFIRKHRDKIIANAKILYKQKIGAKQDIGYVKSALDYKKLETLCDAYKVE